MRDFRYRLLPVFADLLQSFYNRPALLILSTFALLAFAGALVLTFPIWLTVNYLGQPDNGVIAAIAVPQRAKGSNIRSQRMAGVIGTWRGW